MKPRTCKRDLAVFTFVLVVAFLVTGAFPKPTEAVAQRPALRIYGVGYGPRAERPPGGELVQVPVELSEDRRYARFRLMVSVRNDGAAKAYYKLHVQVVERGRADVSPLFDVEKASVRREPYDVVLDFALSSSSGGGGLATPSPIILPPSNPVRVELVLMDQDGRELERKPFHIILQYPRTPETGRLRRDLRVESARFVFVPERNTGIYRIKARVDVSMVVRNVGIETWGFRCNVLFELKQGTPETRLENIGAEGMPTEKFLPLPSGLRSNAEQTVSTNLEARLRSEGPTFGGVTIRVVPPLRSGVWYTLTASIASEADLDPSNDSVHLVFMLNDDKTIRESRTIRVTNRVRVLRS